MSTGKAQVAAVQNERGDGVIESEAVAEEAEVVGGSCDIALTWVWQQRASRVVEGHALSV